jgi:NMD protein affecting ribosome stability and mRNA decay
MMHQSYCFKCGSYTAIDYATALCASCYKRWTESRKPAARTTQL